jgi:hypothetical protein
MQMEQLANRRAAAMARVSPPRWEVRVRVWWWKVKRTTRRMFS